jgi:hypothetical protein
MAHTALLPRNAVCEFKSSTRFVQPNSDVMRNKYFGAPAASAGISLADIPLADISFKTFCEQYHSTKNSGKAPSHAAEELHHIKLIYGCIETR